MATILKFPKLEQSAVSTSPERQSPARATCEIVVFPGVRYERWDEQPVKAKRKSRQKPRDRLEIVV